MVKEEKEEEAGCSTWFVCHIQREGFPRPLLLSLFFLCSSARLS